MILSKHNIVNCYICRTTIFGILEMFDKINDVSSTKIDLHTCYAMVHLHIPSNIPQIFEMNLDWKTKNVEIVYKCILRNPKQIQYM